jgi:NAD+ synthetase
MEDIIKNIQEQVENYLVRYNIKSLIIGVSGGLDSGINCALLRPICDKLNIPLIGRYIHIETNKEEEMQRANAIGQIFCHDYKAIDLTEMYYKTLPMFEEGADVNGELFNEKIRRGNIKARLRMIHLYNLASAKQGIVVDNDNQTEHLLGFWTINGDVGDITPLFGLFKTEVYDLAKCYLTMLEDENAKSSLQAVIDAVPTDGLGITSSDVEQFGVSSYNEVDDVLKNFKYNSTPTIMEDLIKKYGKDIVDKILLRHKNSDFKRNHPYRIKVTSGTEKM